VKVVANRLKGIRANPNLGTIGFDGGINSAILRCEGTPDSDPVSVQPPSVMPLNEVELHVRVSFKSLFLKLIGYTAQCLHAGGECSNYFAEKQRLKFFLARETGCGRSGCESRFFTRFRAFGLIFFSPLLSLMRHA
jgi:hypothetical protein